MNMSTVPVEHSISNRKAPQNLILESKALQWWSSVSRHNTAEKQHKCRGQEDKSKPSVFRDNTYALTVSLPKQAGGAPLFALSCKPSTAKGRASDAFNLQNTRYLIKGRSRNFSEQNIIHALRRSRSVSDCISELSGVCCGNAISCIMVLPTAS